MSSLFSNLRTNLLGIFAITGSYCTYRYSQNCYRLHEHILEARRLSHSRNIQKTLIITDTSNYNHKYFKKYAEPILKESSADFIMMSADPGNFDQVVDYVSRFPSNNVIISGDDKYMNEIVNKLYAHDQNFLAGLTIGFIPLGKDSCLFKRLGVSDINSIKISVATLICLKGLPVDFHPLIIESENLKTISLGAIKTGKWGYFEYLLSNDKKYYFGPLKYPIYYNQAWKLKNPDCKISFNFMDKDPRSLDSNGFSIDVAHVMLSPLKLRYISNDSALAYLCGNFALYRCPFQVSEFAPASHRGIVFNVDGNEIFVYSDGKCVAKDLKKLKISQSEHPLFKINTFYEFQKTPDIKETLSIAECLRM